VASQLWLRLRASFEGRLTIGVDTVSDSGSTRQLQACERINLRLLFMWELLPWNSNPKHFIRKRGQAVDAVWMGYLWRWALASSGLQARAAFLVWSTADPMVIIECDDNAPNA
jgi:hypothetical protein